MGRRPCCPKEINKGAWSREEDDTLSKYVSIHGEGKWQKVAQNAGLKRCGKSCRQRWLNYLKPGIKRGDISVDEEDMIIRLHRLLGNRWALIAKRLPGRTDNEIKNYWNTNLSKKLQKPSSVSSVQQHKKEEKKSTKQALHVLAPRPSRVNEYSNYRHPSNKLVEGSSDDDEEANNSFSDFLNQQLLITDDSNNNNNNNSPPTSSSEKFDPDLETLLDVELKRMASFLGVEND